MILFVNSDSITDNPHVDLSRISSLLMSIGGYIPKSFAYPRIIVDISAASWSDFVDNWPPQFTRQFSPEPLMGHDRLFFPRLSKLDAAGDIDEALSKPPIGHNRYPIAPLRRCCSMVRTAHHTPQNPSADFPDKIFTEIREGRFVL